MLVKLDLFFCSGVYSPDYDNCSNVQYANKQPRRLGKGDFGTEIPIILGYLTTI